MATPAETLAWLRRETVDVELPSGVCPVLGPAIYDWRDWLRDQATRDEFVDGVLGDALAASEDTAQEPARRLALVTWLQDVAYPAWLTYAQLRPGEDLDDAFAEAVALNQGNGVDRVNSELGMAGVSPAAFACAGIRLGRTKDRLAMKARAAMALLTPKVRVARGAVIVAGREEVAVEEEISPLKIRSRCFRLAFTQAQNPVPTTEALMESFGALMKALLGVP